MKAQTYLASELLILEMLSDILFSVLSMANYYFYYYYDIIIVFDSSAEIEKFIDNSKFEECFLLFEVFSLVTRLI